MKRWLALGLMIGVILMFSACSGGVTADEAHETFTQFILAVGKEDYVQAASLLHPEKTKDAEDLQEFFETLENDTGADFSKGIAVMEQRYYSSSYYHSDVDGARYELGVETMVGAYTFDFTVEIVKNEDGYGIYNLRVDPC